MRSLIEGESRPDDDAADVRGFGREEVKDLKATESTKVFLRKIRLVKEGKER
jgi:hypothetical protein